MMKSPFHVVLDHFQHKTAATAKTSVLVFYACKTGSYFLLRPVGKCTKFFNLSQ